MNVEIGAEAALFPEKEYIKGIFVAVLAVMIKNIQVKTKIRTFGRGRVPERPGTAGAPALPADGGRGAS
jgi:hypothetical protein